MDRKPTTPRGAPALENAFRTAIYRVRMPRGHFDLRVDDAVAAHRLHTRLSPRPRTDAWVITPCNPGGRRALPWTNARRRRELEQALCRRGIPWQPAVNLDPTGDWPDEPAVCAWNLSERTALGLGRRFGQAALLRIPHRGKPELFWV